MEEKAANFSEIASKFIGQKVAVLCARYQYRGILSHVTSDCLLLSNAASVEVSGQSTSSNPQTEDYIGSDIVIKNDAIEILYQPNWVFANLGEE